MAAAQRGGGVPAAMGEASTGPFGAGKVTNQPKMNAKGMGSMMPQLLKDLAKTREKDNSGGSGQYKAGYSTVAGFDRHTIYAPKVIPPDVKLPVIIWGNGACSGDGTGFSKFLTEIASHGYFIVANGKPGAGMSSTTKASDLPDAIDWIYANAGKGPYATVDKTRLAAAGQSCGGIQAYSASLDPRVTLTGIFNSGLISRGNTVLFEKLHAPVGWFLGGPTDIAFENGESDYKVMPAKIPTVKLNLDVGHGGTYMEKQGGKFGKAAVAFFDWQMKGDKSAGQQFLSPDTSPLAKDGWKIEFKGWNITH